MAVLSRLLVGSQQRLDLPDILAIESYVSSDFKNLIKSLVGSTPMILKGFEIIDAPLSINNKSVSIRVANSVLYHPQSTAGSFFYGLEEGSSLALPLVPELKGSSGSSTTVINYVYITLSSQGYAQDTRAFWDVDLNSGEGGEFNQIVNTQSVLKVDVGVSVSTFPDGAIPIAKIKMSGDSIVEITDCRNMMFRLGSGGLLPDPENTYSFRSLPSSSYTRDEPPISVSGQTLPSPFFGGDKNIYTLKEWMDVVMTKLLELSGTTYWYESAPTMSMLNIFDDALGSSIKSKGQWTHNSSIPGKVTWSEDIVYRKINDPREIIIRSNSSTGVTLANEEIMFIELIRNKRINSVNPEVTFKNGFDYVNGQVGSFENLSQGDWIKKTSDNDNLYLRIENFYTDLGAGGATATPANAKSIKLSSTYQGTDEYTSAVYTKGEYTNASIQTASRSSSSPWLLGGNLYWLANRSDTVQSILNITPSLFTSIVNIQQSDGKRAKLVFPFAHGLVDGDRVVVSNASSYNGTYQVEIESTTIAVIETTVTTNASNATVGWSIVTTTERLSSGGFQLESANHRFESNQTVLISNTGTLYDTYNSGLYKINTRSDTTFQIPYNANTSAYTGTASCARINLRTEFGAARVIQGESLDINEPDSANILKFIGMDSLSQSSPVYALPSSYNTLQGFQNFNSDSTDNITTRVSKLTAMMADRVQDRDSIIHGRVTFRNTTSDANQVISSNGNLYIEKPGSPKQTISIPSSFNLLVNQALIISLDREANTSITPVVETLYEPYLLQENKRILFYRFSDTSVYSWHGVEIKNSSSWTSNDHENAQNKNITVIDKAGISLAITGASSGYFYYKNPFGSVKILINGSSVDNTIDVTTIAGLSTSTRTISNGQSIWVRVNRVTSKTFNNIQTNASYQDSDANGSLYITNKSDIPVDEDVFVLYTVDDLLLSTINHSTPVGNIYEENLEILVDTLAGSYVYLPVDSRSNNETQSYAKGAGQLEVYLNGQRLILDVDWLEAAGTNYNLYNYIIINQNISAGDVLTFRIGGTGGVYFSSTGNFTSLQNAYNISSTINVNAGDPVKINAGTDTALKVTGKIELNTLTLPTSDGISGQFITTNGSGTLSWASVGSGYSLQQLNTTQSLSNWVNRLSALHTKNTNAIQKNISYLNAVTAVSNAYRGAVYSPLQNRIYLVPYAQGAQTNWHYIDCTTGNVVAYAHGASGVLTTAYWGGVYSPTQNRIYLVPYNQGSQTNWQYIDCNTGSVVSYAHGTSTFGNGYRGGVYSPTQNRIYLVPYLMSGLSSTWHYIDCNTGSVVAYTHGATVGNYGYETGVYSPAQNRIYLVPNGQANQTSWHYIDCATGNVVAYTHGATVIQYGYNGGAFSPTQNRIYLSPTAQADQTNWHYIDCTTGNVVSYAHGASGVLYGAYAGAVYSPTQNRIYLVPYAQGDQTNWHYINCSTGSVVAYSSGIRLSNAYAGGAYSPTQNRIYLAPYAQANQTTWDHIASTARADMEPHEFGSTIISSTY